MEVLKPLIETRELRTAKLSVLLRRGASANLSYSQSADTFRVLFVPPETDTFVHYLDGDVALVVDSDDLEVVGFHIESFVRQFLPAHAGVQKVWRLSDTEVQFHNLGDLILQFEKAKESATREIVNATRQIITEKHRELIIPAYA